MTRKKIRISDLPYELRTYEFPDHCSVYLIGNSQVFPIAVAEANPVNDPEEWWIPRVLVKDVANRGKGLGSVILQELLAICISAGAKKVLVTPGGYENNQVKQFNFYQKNGFVMTDTQGLFEWQPK